MTTFVSSPIQQFVLEGVSWELYDHTLREIEASHQRVNVTYDDGRMEMMTMGGNHERVKKAIARLLELYSLEKDIPITGYGSVTCRRKRLRKGAEPDECYYVQTPPPPGGQEQLDLNKYPPPDLVIEVDITRGSIEREPIYAALGVREIWRYEVGRIVPMHLQAGRYESAQGSLAFPELDIEQFNRFLTMALEKSQHEAAKAMRKWLTGKC